MLGPNTPVYRGLYYIPFINRFRAPARHALRWTFALAVLSAYGWDAAGAVLSHARTVFRKSERERNFPVCLDACDISSRDSLAGGFCQVAAAGMNRTIIQLP